MSSEICGSLNLEQNQGSMYPVPAVPEPGGCVFCGNGVDCVGDGLIQSLGLASLARKTRPDHGARKVVSEPMKRAIEGLALESHAIPITSVHRQIKEYAEAIGDAVPSYWTVYDIVREVPPNGIDAIVLREGRAGHWGLGNIRERARSIGAALRLSSHP